MESSTGSGSNSHKRSFDDMNSSVPEKGINECTDFTPRSYQLKAYEVARRRNTISVLKTGSGKTMIAVMLMKDVGKIIMSSSDKKLIVFLAPTVHLVHQQFEVIKKHTNFRVEEYYGAKGVDEWNSKCWEKEISENDVLVMTPQLLYNALEKAYLSMEMICLLILDECHHATGNHPYARIMMDFYHISSNKPKIFGMTASPVVSKGVSSTENCEAQMSELESILDSQMYTVEDRTEMEIYVPSAKETPLFYDPSPSSKLDVKEKIEASWAKFDDSISRMHDAVGTRYKDMDEKMKTLKRCLSNYHAKIFYCLDDLGLLCAYEAVKICLEKKEEHDFFRESSFGCIPYLKEVLHIIEASLPPGVDNFSKLGPDYQAAVRLCYISPKLLELIRLLLSLGKADHILCLIFVDRIVTAKVIERFAKKVAFLSHFSVSYLTGRNTSADALAPKVQKEVLESFCAGKVNLLFTTDVIEEGIHVPDCSYVIRFDLPKTVRSYIQSRGRARQDGSEYILMLERGNAKQRDLIFDLIRSERSMRDTATNRDPYSWDLKPCDIMERSKYIVDATGASVSVDSSVSLVQRYCSKLPHDKYFVPKPNFEIVSSGGSFQCILTLPPNAAFQKITGPLSRNPHLAKQQVCLEACKKLHEMGELDDHLVPSFEHTAEEDAIIKSKESASGPGTTKRKELHGTAFVRAFSGKWGQETNSAILQAYKFDFTCNIDYLYSSFVLLLESKLDDDVGNVELDLYLVKRRVKASISFCGEVNLVAGQLRKARVFQEFFFNGLFGKLSVHSAASGRKFLLQNDDTKSLWNPSYMYLLLPLEGPSTGVNTSWKIDWKVISSSVNAVEILRKSSLLGPRQNKENETQSFSSSDRIVPDAVDSVIHFAQGFFDAEKVRNMVVVAIHTGKIYAILEVTKKCSESPFEPGSDKASSKFASYGDYFKKKYGIDLRYPKQPLLLLKQSHNPHNLLVDFNKQAKKKPEGGEKSFNNVHMPPELLLTIGAPLSVMKSMYLLPSLMHRMESLMLASQLREEIGFQDSNFNIPSSLILEALTTLGCCESFSMERLELLGDSVLKYAVSCHLFLKYSKKHEGQLTARRSLVICNATLHKRGTDHKLQGYIRDLPFDPRRWIAPGQLSIYHVPCKCGVDTLEVPLDSRYCTEDPKVVLRKCCDMGHRWMGSKTISDCVEALIGAYYVSGGLTAARHLMKWLGMDVEIEPAMIKEAIEASSLPLYVPKGDSITALESKIGYSFCVKGLLQEAIMHPSFQEEGVSRCYERLEFLGDSVLDILITWHLYQNHQEIDPGELTDLRSASVSNDNFAQCAVRHDLQPHLQHSSMMLLSEVEEYVKLVKASDTEAGSIRVTKAPKALGDLMESIAGAMLVDTKLNLDEVWKIFKPLLSPLVTPDKLELPPWRELNELCDRLGFFIKENCTSKGDTIYAEISLQLNDVLLTGDGSDRSRKGAKGKAALQLLKKLETRGISHASCVTKRKKQDDEDAPGSFVSELRMGACNKMIVDDSSNIIVSKKQRTQSHSPEEVLENLSLIDETLKESNRDCSSPVHISIAAKKGAPRMSLFELCKKFQWPMPRFDTDEEKSRIAFEFDEGGEKRTGFSCFTSTVTLLIPNSGSIKCTGEGKADKRSSCDSAALAVLYKLREEGKITIDTSG